MRSYNKEELLSIKKDDRERRALFLRNHSLTERPPRKNKALRRKCLSKPRGGVNTGGGSETHVRATLILKPAITQGELTYRKTKEGLHRQQNPLIPTRKEGKGGYGPQRRGGGLVSEREFQKKSRKNRGEERDRR